MFKPTAKIASTIGAVFLLSTIFHFENQDAFDLILIFLSITSGFSITALSIIATSRFSKNLYKKESEKNNDLSLLHVLVNKFEKLTTTFLLTIILIIIHAFLDPIKISNISIFSIELGVKSTLSGTIWVFTFVSFWQFLELLKLFSKFVIKSAKYN